MIQNFTLIWDSSKLEFIAPACEVTRETAYNMLGAGLIAGMFAGLLIAWTAHKIWRKKT